MTHTHKLTYTYNYSSNDSLHLTHCNEICCMAGQRRRYIIRDRHETEQRVKEKDSDNMYICVSYEISRETQG